jgi:hypothetical protein
MNASGTGWSFTAVPDAKAPTLMYKVVNGVEYGPFAFGDRTYFSRDGKGFYYWARIEGKNGGSLLNFNGKTYGPYSVDNDDKLFDLEAGHFAMLIRTKQDVSVRVNDVLYGPYASVRILRAGEWGPDQNGPYFGFVAYLKDGRKEIHLEGDKIYGPYREVDDRRAIIAKDGSDWLIGVRKDGLDGETLLQNGIEMDTDGLDIRRLAGGYLAFVRKGGTETFFEKERTTGPYTKVERYWVTRNEMTWVAEAIKGDGPAQTSRIIVNGAEYTGERLHYVNTAAEEYFFWFSFDADAGASVSLLRVR